MVGGERGDMSEARKLPYRLGLDVGSNSLGWFVVWLDENGNPKGLGPGGVRIYPDGRDPKSKTSNAVDRRVARGARRRRDRYLRRRDSLMSLLITHGLMPADEVARKALETLDPYELRARALGEALPAHSIGRALFHLNQRRGFLSNRKTEKGDSESGAIKEAAGRLQELMRVSGARTLGEFFHDRQRTRQPVRARNRSAGAKAEYEFYPTRQLLLDEFDAIWTKQAPHHPAMTAEARAAIHHAIFFQRPLRQPPVGKCSLSPASGPDDEDGFRCPWAHPLAQRFRIWQEVRNLAVLETGKTARALAKSDGDKIALALFQNGKLSFDKIRALLKLPREARFNLESEKRDHLLGDETAAKLAHKSLFGKVWRSLALDRQIAIVARLLDEPDEGALVAWLTAQTGLDDAAAERVASAFLPDGHCRLGLRAIKAVLPHMEDGMTKTQAEDAAGYKGMHEPDGELSLNGRLPYYGEWLPDDVLGTGDPRDKNDKRWGRFPNPTVHIGLGQLRRVVNALVRNHGAPAEVAVEMTRAFKLSPDKLAEIEKEQAANQRKNDERREAIQKHGQSPNARNVLKLRLWEELNASDPLDRRCPFSGENIGIARLLSDEVEIEHLIPFSESLDDSAANKVICLRSANRLKGKRTPFEAFGASAEWSDIAQRAAGLPKNKRWRFDPDARQRYAAEGGFQARQLNETGWLARVAQHYLAAVTDPYKIHVLPGKLTSMIRGKWGLNTLLPDHNFSDVKNRKDHRHHAIDAMVAALTDRSLLQRMASAYDEERDRIEILPPWPTVRDDLDAKLKGMTVSHKPDHGPQAQLHEDTAYGTVKQPEKEGGANLVYRKPFIALNDKEIGRIRDIRLRELVQKHVASEKAAGKDLKAALQSFAARKDIPGVPNGVRHVRLTKTEKPEYLVALQDKSGKPYKAYSAGENAFVEIFETADGKWLGEAVSVFKANQSEADASWPARHPGARLVMRVFKGDLIALDTKGQRVVMVVHRLDASINRFKLAAHNETGNLDDRHADETDPFRWLMASYSTLKTMNAERVRVDEIGRLWRVRPEEAARG
jgi:CRISPR-associated endonuclease Csn1